mgnify:FL=1
MELFLNNSTYHFVVKPPHLERDFEELKDNTIRVMIGAYKMTQISTR